MEKARAEAIDDYIRLRTSGKNDDKLLLFFSQIGRITTPEGITYGHQLSKPLSEYYVDNPTPAITPTITAQKTLPSGDVTLSLKFYVLMFCVKTVNVRFVFQQDAALFEWLHLSNEA